MTDQAKEALKANPVVDQIIGEINSAADSKYIQVTVSKVTPKIPSRVRNIIYNVGMWLGFVGIIAAPAAALLTGEAGIAVTSIGALALALTNLLAKLNLSTPVAEPAS